MNKTYVAEIKLPDVEGRLKCYYCPFRKVTKEADEWIRWGCILTGKEIYIGGMDMGPCPSSYCPLVEVVS
jgi:hypothetical protein